MKKQKNQSIRSSRLNYLLLALGFILAVFCINYVSALTPADCYLGGTVTVNGNYCVHTFTTDGSFNITATTIVDSLTIGGGAGGGAGENSAGGGGGAGGLIYNTSMSLSEGNYSIIIGTGGAGGATTNCGSNGGNTTFNNNLAQGGGGGGSGNSACAAHRGGSGGGSDAGGSFGAGAGVWGQGTNGGFTTFNAGGGGGGAGVNGTGAPADPTGGAGGDGLAYTLYNGTNIYYAGGGGGAGDGTGGAGGLGGGGAGTKHGVTACTAGVDGYGGGGGGGTWTNGAGCDGGDGVVIITYFIAPGYVTSETYNATTYETANENIILNLTLYNYTSSSASLWYNGTEYPITGVVSGSNTLYIKSFAVPLVNSVTNNNFYWTLALSNSTATVYFNTTTHTQTVNPIYFVFCNSTINVPYVNYTFKDEETGTNIQATITSTFNYTIGDGTYTKTYTFQNTTENINYAFCFTPTDKSVIVIPRIQYANQNSTLRTYNSNNIFSNSTTSIPLYLLKTSDGIYSSYQVVTTTQNPVSNALVTVYLNNILIESRTTDSSGIATFWLNPNSIYVITASKLGFPTTTVSISPSQQQYTITLGASNINNVTYYNNGINISTSPTSSYLNQTTYYTFQVNLTSLIYTLDNWGFNITNGNDIIGTVTLPQTVKSYSIIATTGENTSNSVIVWWTINGTTNYLTRSYTIEAVNLTDSGFSIYNGLIDLKSYLNSGGVYGLSGSSLNILIFLFIMITTGISTYKFGLNSPAIIAGILTIQVFLFDVVLGLVYYDPGFFGSRVPHIATVFMGIILVGLIIREGTSY